MNRVHIMNIWKKHYDLLLDKPHFIKKGFSIAHKDYYGQNPYQIVNVDTGENLYSLFYIKFPKQIKVYILYYDLSFHSIKVKDTINIYNEEPLASGNIRIAKVHICKSAYNDLRLNEIFNLGEYAEGVGDETYYDFSYDIQKLSTAARKALLSFKFSEEIFTKPLNMKIYATEKES